MGFLCLLSLWPAGCRKKTGGNNPENRTFAVEVTPVSERDFRETVKAVGSVTAKIIVEIKTELAGIVEKVNFEEGGGVSAGDLLFSIDDKKLQQELAARQAALAGAKAANEYAKKSYHRYQELVVQDAAAEIERDQWESEYHTSLAEISRLKAEIALIKENLADSRIRAPTDGTVSQSLVDPGDYVDVGMHLATVYTPGRMEAAFTIPQRYIDRVRLGQEIELTVDAYPGRTFTGSVTFISPNVEELTRSFLVKAAVDNNDMLLKSGVFATVVLTLEVHEHQPCVPEESLVATTAGYVIYVVKDNTAHRRAVEPGLRETGLVQISKGVSIGEQVVKTGQMRLSDGSRVSTTGPPSRTDTAAGR